MADYKEENFALCCRLKTKRRRKRLQKAGVDKRLIHLYHELKRIGKEKRNLEYIELNPPIQRGWVRQFELREDVAGSKYAAFFQEILDKINTCVYSNRKDFKKKKRRFGKKIYVPTEQKLRELDSWALRKITLSEKEKEYFRTETRYIKNSNYIEHVLVFTEPWRFVLKVRPNMLRYVQVLNPELIQQEAAIDRKLSDTGQKGRMWKLMHGSYQYHYNWKTPEKDKYRLFLKQYSIRKELEEYYNEKTTWENKK